MNLERVDLNLLVYLDVLLQEKNVTRAAAQLGITQPAMSNGLKRLRELFNDPLMIRSSSGMAPTERALELAPLVRQALSAVTEILEPKQDFRPLTSKRVFRIMTSDYAEATLMPALVKALRSEAPDVVLDFLTPSDVSIQDIEQGKVDLAINRFNEIPLSFHQVTLWSDSFSCLLNRSNPAAVRFNLKTYLESQHIWVSKTGMGIGFGMNPDRGGMGQIDAALERISGMTDLYVSITQDYVQTLDLIDAEFRALAAKGDMPALAAYMHTLKGTSATLGAVPLSEQAARMEKLFRKPEADTVPLDHLGALLELVRPTQEAAAQAIAALTSPSQAPEQTAPKAVDPQQQHKALAFLKTLADLLAHSDLTALEKFAQRGDALDALDASSVAALGQALDGLNVTAAHTLCMGHIDALTDALS